MDPTFAKSLPFKPHNQTSNQLLVNEQMSIPENREMFLQAVKEYKDHGWEAVLDRIVRPPPFPTFCHRRKQSLHKDVFAERPPLCPKHRQHPGTCSATNLTLPCIRHRKSSCTCSQLRPRVREGRHLERSFLYQDPMHRARYERRTYPSQRWDSDAGDKSVWFAAGYRRQSGWMSLYQPLLQRYVIII